MLAVMPMVMAIKKRPEAVGYSGTKTLLWFKIRKKCFTDRLWRKG